MAELWFNFALLLVLNWISYGTSFSLANCTAETSNCTVVGGHAACESSELKHTVKTLPSCVQYLELSLTGKTVLYPKLFDHFTAVKEINIYVKSQSIYDKSHMGVSGDNVTSSFFTSRSLKVLRLSMFFYFVNIASDSFRSLTSLEILDLTRTAAAGLGKITEAFPSTTIMPIRKLLLKNVQEFNRGTQRYYSEGVDIAKLICPFRNTLEVLDLSYNDITTLFLGNPNCLSKLKYLDLRYNFLMDVTKDSAYHKASVMDYVITLSVTEVVKIGHQWELTHYQQDLWNDEDDDSVDEDNEDMDRKVLKFENHHSLIDDLLTWLKSLVARCPGINFTKLPLCLPELIVDICKAFKCLHPNISPSLLSECYSNFKNFAKDFFPTVCNFTDCFFGITIPIWSTLEEVTFNDVLRPGKNTIESHTNGTALCFFENNNLQRLDFSNTHTRVDRPMLWSNLYIRGLVKLKFLSIQNCQLPFVINRRLFAEMPNLEELHAGGNVLGDNQSVPEEIFHQNLHLRILNLSNSDLVSIPKDTFLHSYNLTMLDLSQNKLSSENLNFDLSNTKLKWLNFSKNNIGSIPRQMRRQLEELAPLQIDLSENPLQCDCHDISFVHWAQKTDFNNHINFSHKDTYVCLYKSQKHWIFSVNVDHLRRECSQWLLPVMASMATLSFVVLIGLIVLIHRKRWAIRHFLFLVRERYETLGTDVVVPNYHYDAFILYSSEDGDRKWVHFELVKQLEQNFGFKLCIHHRDFIGGMDIADNIEMGIRNSRKVVAILSRDFLKSNYGTTEINMTCSVDASKLIMVMFNELPRDTYIPYMLRYLLETQTYIEWDEDPNAQKLFWKRLCKALYTKPKKHQ